MTLDKEADPRKESQHPSWRSCHLINVRSIAVRFPIAQIKAWQWSGRLLHSTSQVAVVVLFFPHAGCGGGMLWWDAQGLLYGIIKLVIRDGDGVLSY